MEKLRSDLGSIALFKDKDLELLAEFDPEELAKNYDLAFLRQIQEAADRHLTEKREIRDAVGLLNIYHQSSKSPSKRRKSSKK